MPSTSTIRTMAHAAILSLVTLSGCIAVPTTSQPVIDTHQVIEAPIALYANKLLLPITINGHSYTAVYDSGAESSAISSAAAQELGLKGHGGGVAQGFGGSITYEVAPTFSVEFGTTRQAFKSLPIFDFSRLNASLGKRFDFIFGSDAMRGHVVEIDSRGNHIRWTPRSTFSAPKDAVMLHMGRQRGVYTLPMQVNGVTGAAGIDIGSGSALAVSSAFAKKAGFTTTTGATKQGTGIGGNVESGLTSAPSALLAGTLMHDVPTVLHPGELPGGGDINLGLPLLLRFHLFLDYEGRRMWFAAPPDSAVKPFERNLVGLRLVRLGTDRVKVLHVSDKSPAHAAGLASGDLLVAIDDVRIADWPSDAPIDTWMSGPENATKTLTLADGRKVTLTLKRYY